VRLATERSLSGDVSRIRSSGIYGDPSETPATLYADQRTGAGRCMGGSFVIFI
jgi:hypothetical protein